MRSSFCTKTSTTPKIRTSPWVAAALLLPPPIPTHANTCLILNSSVLNSTDVVFFSLWKPNLSSKASLTSLSVFEEMAKQLEEAGYSQASHGSEKCVPEWDPSRDNRRLPKPRMSSSGEYHNLVFPRISNRGAIKAK